MEGKLEHGTNIYYDATRTYLIKPGQVGNDKMKEKRNRKRTRKATLICKVSWFCWGVEKDNKKRGRKMY